jgi:hypothetical protein
MILKCFFYLFCMIEVNLDMNEKVKKSFQFLSLKKNFWVVHKVSSAELPKNKCCRNSFVEIYFKWQHRHHSQNYLFKSAIVLLPVRKRFWQPRPLINFKSMNSFKIWLFEPEEIRMWWNQIYYLWLLATEGNLYKNAKL